MNKITKLKLFCNQNSIDFSQSVPLREHCTFKIGGIADCMAWPSTHDALVNLLAYAEDNKIQTLILGKGSNMLFADSGFSGLVITLDSHFSNINMLDDVTIQCESGASLMSLCKFAQEQGLSGIEFAYGIPGTVGGAVYMNAGAYGGEMKDILVRVHHANHQGRAGEYSGKALELSYRHSIYSDSSLVITKVVVRLQKGDKTEILAKMTEFMGRRKEKQPLEYPSAGSVFRRPPGAYASALIDKCGLKGKTVGGAQVSEKHAGFIVNTGGATCVDVLKLINIVQNEVNIKTGYNLECEIKVIG